MGLQRSISNLSKSFVPNLLLCLCFFCSVTEERHYLGIMIVIYSPDINQIPCTVFLPFFTFSCQFLFNESCLNPHWFLPLHILLYYSWRCIRRSTSEKEEEEEEEGKKKPAKGITTFLLVVVFVCLPPQWNLIHLGAFVIWESEIIQQYKLLTRCLLHHALTRLREIIAGCYERRCFEYVGNQINSEMREGRQEAFSCIFFFFIVLHAPFSIKYTVEHTISKSTLCMCMRLSLSAHYESTSTGTRRRYLPLPLSPFPPLHCTALNTLNQIMC